MNKVCIDTNIWLYAFIVGQNPAKQTTANQLIQNQTDMILSNQIIAEVSVNLLKKAGMTEVDLQALTEAFYAHYTIISLSETHYLKASELRQRFTFSFWDSLIVAVALLSNCKTLYSEDMHHSQIIDNQLTIINPFLP
jgi:predicted nucleic acid-binding protein